MYDFIMEEDIELWDVIYDGPFVPMKTIGEGTITVLKTRKEYSDTDRKAIEKNFRAKKILAHYKHNADKAFPDKKFKRRDATDNIMKQALAPWGDSFSKYEGDDEQGDTSMMAVESKSIDYDSIFAPMARSDEDEDEYNDDDKAAVRGGSQKWYMDSSCSKYMTRRLDDFLSLKSLQCGSVSFENDKKGYILGVGKIGKTLSHSIENMYYVNDFDSLNGGDLTCLSVIDNDAKLWHRRLGHASFSLLNKLIKKDLVRGLPKSKFKYHKVCDASLKGKQVRSSFKPKKEVSTLRQLNLFHMDMYGPMRMPRRGRKKYIFIQVKIGYNVVSIISDHGTEFDNAKFDELCVEHGISHNCFAPRTPQQNGIVERKNRTLEGMARRMLIDSGMTKRFWAEVVNTASYKVYNKRTQCVNESVYVIFDESHHSSEKDSHDKDDHDGDFSNVPGEVIDMENGKTDLMSQVKETSEEDAAELPTDLEKPGPYITTTEADNRVADAILGTLDAEQRSDIHTSIDTNDGSHMEEPGPSRLETQVSNCKHISSHPLQNVIAPLDSGIQTRSEEDVFVKKPSSFECHEQPEHVFKIDKALYGLKQDPHAWCKRLSRFLLENGFTRGKIDNTLFLKKRGRNLLIVQLYVDDIIFGAINYSLCEEFAKLMGSEFEMSMMGELNFFLGLQIKQQLEDFGVFSECVPLLCDNTSALNMAKNSVRHKRTKHIDVRHHFPRDNVEKGVICMKFCKT
ncbi:uncharacterized protein LOC142168067 [Nicotiana tabacum]|uniref:Uncharacterized protein LOC142168067 n=1 Tax=Nicotiana tabacum TaxID=4097 RepID=A0AC58SIQ0_TOBAC